MRRFFVVFAMAVSGALAEAGPSARDIHQITLDIDRAGFSYGWETQDWDRGNCDINFLDGNGVRLRRQEPADQSQISRIKLADWSSDKKQSLLERYCFEQSHAEI